MRDAIISDEENTADEAGPALEEEQYTRPRPPSVVGGEGTAVPPTLTLSLVSSHHSLWGHRLWNAALLLAGECTHAHVFLQYYAGSIARGFEPISEYSHTRARAHTHVNTFPSPQALPIQTMILELDE